MRNLAIILLLIFSSGCSHTARHQIDAHASNARLGSNPEDTATIDYQGPLIGDALWGLGEVFDMQVVIPWELRASRRRIRMKVVEATRYQLLYALLRDTSFSYVEDGNTIRIIKRKDSRIEADKLRLQLSILKLKNDN